MEWISVKDRMPAEPRQVLVRFLRPRFGVPTECYETGYFEDAEPCAESCKKCVDYGWLYWRDNKHIGHPVTHWMPLPEPPEDD